MRTELQGTEKWQADRSGRVTASRFKDVIAWGKPDKNGKREPMGARASYMRELCFERLAKKSKHNVSSASMKWGHTEEQKAQWRRLGKQGTSRPTKRSPTGASRSEEARDLFDEAEDIREASSIDYLAGAHYPLMKKLFGDEWWQSANYATEPNPDYEYLERIMPASGSSAPKATQPPSTTGNTTASTRYPPAA